MREQLAQTISLVEGSLAAISQPETTAEQREAALSRLNEYEKALGLESNHSLSPSQRVKRVLDSAAEAVQESVSSLAATERAEKTSSIDSIHTEKNEVQRALDCIERLLAIANDRGLAQLEAHHNPDVGTLRIEDIHDFLASEKAKYGTFGDPFLDDFSIAQVADYMLKQLNKLGDFAPEAMLLLRAAKRMGTKIEGAPLSQLLEDPAGLGQLYDAIMEARQLYTDSTEGPNHPITSPYPRTPQEMQSLNDLLTTVGQDLNVGTVTIGSRRARLGGLILESFHPAISLRYDNPHTIKDGEPVSPEKVRKEHGPGGDMRHIDVEFPDRPGRKCFKGEDGVVYKFEDSRDPGKRSLFRLIDGKSGKEWEEIRDYRSHSYKIAKE